MSGDHGPAAQQLAELSDGIAAFVRAFGLHRPDLTPCGMPVSVSEAHAMVELAGGPLGQSALAAQLALSKSTVSRLVAHLEARGWVERQPDPTDRRAVRLALTSSGRTAADRLATARRTRFEALLAALPEADRPRVIDAVHLLTDAARRSDARHA